MYNFYVLYDIFMYFFQQQTNIERLTIVGGRVTMGEWYQQIIHFSQQEMVDYLSHHIPAFEQNKLKWLMKIVRYRMDFMNSNDLDRLFDRHNIINFDDFVDVQRFYLTMRDNSRRNCPAINQARELLKFPLPDNVAMREQLTLCKDSDSIGSCIDKLNLTFN
jgi:hypothetical protein